ncbi:MAG TPA: hypothetical protein PLY87_02510 [Planctomycetaceae bacterium]|nr:hypothetical protein [Planctomycetaceae bacterium]
MSLPTCPSCGQSVLEDDAVDCPFCGAAMDGSRGAKNVPRPQASPPKHRLAKPTAAPSAPVSQTGQAAVSKPAAAATPARPASGPKTKVDEDDPFGIGNAAATQQAIQATAKPDKSRLHKITCPMCEAIGFVPKSAIGKSVRCSNEACLVPIFKATESGEKVTERKPARLSDEAAAAKKAAATSQPAQRNPIIIYAIAGVVLLALAGGLVSWLKKAPNNSDLNKPIEIVRDEKWESEEDREARLAREAEDIARAAKAIPNPKAEVAAIARQMINLARQPNLRDKAWARRMTGDLFLETGESALAAQELKQLVTVDSTKAFYRIEPHVTQYWKHLAAGKQDLARKDLELALADQKGIPATGRAGTEAALSLASVLITEGRTDEARKFVASRRLDTSITSNRDMLASVAWFWIADHSRESVIPVPSVTDVTAWSDPLHTAVSCDLAMHQRWTEAFAWSISDESPAVVSESLSELAAIAGSVKAPADVFGQIVKAAESAKNPVVTVRVHAAIAAALKDKASLESAMSAMAQLSAPLALKLPTTQQIAEQYGVEHPVELLRATAIAEVVRAAVICGDADKATELMSRLRAELNAAAPPTREIRNLTLEVTHRESAARQRIAMDLNTSNSELVDRTFKEYRRHLNNEGNQPGLYVIAEDRRLRAVQLLSRIIRAGGATVVQAALNDQTNGWADEIMLDDLTGLMAAATRRSNQTLPEIMQQNAALKMDGINAGHAALIAKIAPVLAGAWANRNEKLADGLKAIENDCGPLLPGLRQAYINELVASVARSTKEPDYLLEAIGALRNGVWREEAYLIAGRNFAKRKMEADVEAWVADHRMPALEQITLMYGMAQVISDRAVEAPPADPKKG